MPEEQQEDEVPDGEFARESDDTWENIDDVTGPPIEDVDEDE